MRLRMPSPTLIFMMIRPCGTQLLLFIDVWPLTSEISRANTSQTVLQRVDLQLPREAGVASVNC